MRRTLVVLIINIGIVLGGLWPAAAAPQRELRMLELLTPDAVLRWINGYRQNPNPSGVPDVVKALSRMGAFKDPEQSGPYLGFIAGVIGTEQDRAEELIGKMFPLPEENHWVIVRAIAYSAHPDWKHLLRVFAPRMPSRQVMISNYLSNKSPTLFQVAARPNQTAGQKFRSYFSYDTYFGDKKKGPREELEATPELLDTLWGYYFASGRYRPVSRIVAMLPYASDADSVELLTLGNMAKFTLASNAVRDTKLLEMLKQTSGSQPKPIATPLKEVITAAETVETSRLRKEAMASIEELRRKGPASRREVSKWGQIGTGALALGCIGAAATGVGALAVGLPCVVGGALSQAGLKYYESQQ